MSASPAAPGRLDRAACIEDLRGMARRHLPRMVFDYIDGAASEELTARRNRWAFGHCLLEQAILADVAERSVATTLFGQIHSMPVVVGPTGLNGAYWLDGDLCLARAAAAHNVPFVMSTAATTSLDRLAANAGPARWFQLYMMRDRGLVRAFLDRVAAAGFPVLQLTVDTAVAGRRNRDIHNGFTLPFRWSASKLFDCVRHPRWALQMARGGAPELTLFAEVLGAAARGGTISDVMQQQLSSAFNWRDLAWLRAHWTGKLVLKGVSRPEHVTGAIAAGVDGVVVSNHGGRQLDGAASALEQLPAVVDAAQGRLTVLVDSGFRTGTDIAKAIALGADAVQLGRATLYALAAGGEAGVRYGLRILHDELDRAMALCGAASLEQLRGRARLLIPR